MNPIPNLERILSHNGQASKAFKCTYDKELKDV